jgi:hypothetical protein
MFQSCESMKNDIEFVCVCTPEIWADIRNGDASKMKPAFKPVIKFPCLENMTN